VDAGPARLVRPCLTRSARNFCSGLGNKIRSHGLHTVANSTRVNDLRAAELSAHDRQFSRGALAGHAPPTEQDGACNWRDACELIPQRHSNV
jgi:hypothetical protein